MKYHLDLNFVPNSQFEYAIMDYDLIKDKRARRMFTLTHPLGHLIIDKKTFFEAIVYTFPLDPPLSQQRPYNWDAIQDSVQGGLLKLDEELLDIVWLDVNAVANISVPTLIEGIKFFLDATFKFQEFFWGKRNIKTRILLVYEENQPGFSSGFWFPIESV